MSWFYHVSQCSGEQQPQLVDMVTGVTTAPGNATDWPVCASASPVVLPLAPQGPVPLTLQKLSCAPQSAGPGGDALPVSYVTLQEQRCVLSWFLGWSAVQRERFLQDLLGKAVPGKVCTLLDSLNTLQVKDRAPSIFECQLRLWTQWFESWNEEERNHLLHILEEQDPVFVAHFYRNVAGTAGRE